MPLTVNEVKNAKPAEKAYKLADAGGLYLYVTATGVKSWRMKYRYGGKEKVLTFGVYDDVSLAAARDRRDDAKRLLKANRDPIVEQRRAKHAVVAASGALFEVIAREWHADETPRWSAGQARLVLRALERDVFKQIGKLPVSDIDGPTVLTMLRKIERRGAIETAKRVRGYVSAVFERAISEHHIEINPAAKIGKALKPTPKGSKQPALVDLPSLLGLQKMVDESTSTPATKLASRLLALTAVRVGVLRTATWDEFGGIEWEDPDADTPNAIWKISAERMKLDLADKGDVAYDHDVPLSAEAVAVLRALRILTGRLAFLFPSQKSTRLPMSDSAISSLYKRRGYRGRHVPHGWRASFSTIMNEWALEHGREGDRAVIDLMLAHVPKGTSASEYAYNRARHAKRRRELAEVWASMIAAGLPAPQSLLPAR